MDSEVAPRANLKKYIKVEGKWRFVPVLKQNGVPYPGTVLIDGEPVRSTTGTFYLELYENGRRVQRPIGTSPREAKDAWYRRAHSGLLRPSCLAADPSTMWLMFVSVQCSFQLPTS